MLANILFRAGLSDEAVRLLNVSDDPAGLNEKDRACWLFRELVRATHFQKVVPSAYVDHIGLIHNAAHADCDSPVVALVRRG